MSCNRIKGASSTFHDFYNQLKHNMQHFSPLTPEEEKGFESSGGAKKKSHRKTRWNANRKGSSNASRALSAAAAAGAGEAVLEASPRANGGKGFLSVTVPTHRVNSGASSDLSPRSEAGRTGDDESDWDSGGEERASPERGGSRWSTASGPGADRPANRLVGLRSQHREELSVSGGCFCLGCSVLPLLLLLLRSPMPTLAHTLAVPLPVSRPSSQPPSRLSSEADKLHSQSERKDTTPAFCADLQREDTEPARKLQRDNTEPLQRTRTQLSRQDEKERHEEDLLAPTVVMVSPPDFGGTDTEDSDAEDKVGGVYSGGCFFSTL